MNLLDCMDKLAAFLYYVNYDETKYKHLLFIEKFYPFDWGILFVDVSNVDDFCEKCDKYFILNENLCEHLAIEITKFPPNSDLNYHHILCGCNLSEFERIRFENSNFCENNIILGDLNSEEDQIWKKIEEFVFPLFIEPQDIDVQSKDLN